MPINPAYQFMNADASLDDKNQFLDFLRRDAMQKGMGANYAADIGAAQETMNVLGSQRPAQAPRQAPVNNRATPYVSPRLIPEEINAVRQVRGLQPMATEPVQDYEVKGPYIPEQRTTQEGLEGIGSWDELPMSEPQGMRILPPSPDGQTRILPPPPDAPELPQGFENTTLANKARAMGFDPRQLMVALAEFSAGMGNIKGKPTASTARSFYEMQKRYEEKQAERDSDVFGKILAKKEPKSVSPLELARIDLVKTQTDLTRNKAQTEAELNDPTSPRSQALRSALEVYMQKSMKIPNWKAKPEMTGADVYKWLSPLNFAIGQQNMGQRAELETQSRERMLQDKLDAQVQLQGMKGQQQRENVAARTVGKIDTQKPSGAYGEKIQVPGWRKTQNVPVEKTELKQFRDRSSKVPRVIEKINQLKGMIQKYGAFENPYNEAGTLMRQLSNDIKLDLKGPEFKALGVLAGPDMSILEALIPDTSNPKNALRGDSSVIRSLDMLTQNLQKDLDAAALQLGFEKDAEQSAQPTTTGPRGEKLWKP